VVIGFAEGLEVDAPDQVQTLHDQHNYCKKLNGG
jgi:hypothetical protein